MATANFYLINAQSYYVITDDYEIENENGEKEVVVRDEWEVQDLLDDIRYNGKESGLYPNYSKEWNDSLDARELCYSDTNWERFSKCSLLETNVESTIAIRSGYYAHAVLDYEVKVETSQGDEFYLSDYDNVDDLIDDYMKTLEGIFEWMRFSDEGWNVGTFKIQKKNIRKWIEKRIEKEIQKCEEFCKANSDVELCVSARFSNGETWYDKVG